MKSPKDSLLLIDGHAVLYRAFHALPPLKTKDGIPTNAVYGFITTLFKAIEELKPKYCAVAFDVSGPTFRHKAFDGYKASRADTPPDLLTQVPYAYKVAKALNLPIFTMEGFEADDIIGTLARQANEQGVPVVIATGDKDSFQLVNDDTFVYIIRRSITDVALYDEAGVKERMGVLPNQIADFKALSGDASDEIPGIAGIGEKTAVTLLSDGRSLEALYKTLKDDGEVGGVTPRIRQKVIEGEDIARQSQSLATIDQQVPIKLDLEACRIHDYNPDEVAKLFQKLEFFSLVKRLPHAGNRLPSQDPEPNWSYKVLRTKDDITDAVTLLTHKKSLVVDTETDGLKGDILGISLAGDGETGYYIPLIQSHGAQLSPEKIAELLKPLLENESIGKAGHNIKYDMASLTQLGITLSPVSFDTMVAAYILQSHLRSFDLDTVAQRELGHTMIPYAEAAGSEKKSASLKDADGEKVAEYAAEDAVITYRLFEHFAKQLDSARELKEVAEKIDFPLVCVLNAMELHGVCINKKSLESLEKDLEKEITSIRAKIESHAKEPININSPAQLQKLLFEDLGLEKKGIKSTQSGLSTAAQELEKLQGLHPVVDDILRYRELTKLQSTYVTILPKLADETGRIHTQFSQTTAATGRLASYDPNLQNIPIRSELGNKIRTAFVAPQGYDLLSLDYSQIELRIMAHLSDDPNLKQAFRDGRDIHDEVAKRLEIDRRAAKAINFGIMYGLSSYGLSQGLKIELPQAKAYIDAYFATYPRVFDYLEKTKIQIREQGYVETLFGRRREIPEIHASNSFIRAQAERMAINAPAQGTAADLMKLAMIEVYNWLEKAYSGDDTRPYLILQVHDELLLETPHAMTEVVAKHVKDLMENVAELAVPLGADAKVGANWGEMQPLKI